MWQSSGKYVPTVDQLLEVAPAIIDMGCFARVETNGGGFEQINLLFGENPNVAVRKWTQPFNDAGIQTHMLERGLNGIRRSCSADVRPVEVSVKKKQGTDICRTFDGLNIAYTEDPAGYASGRDDLPGCIESLLFWKWHPVEYYTRLADT
jgi:pyruvate carboxylase subunit B